MSSNADAAARQGARVTRAFARAAFWLTLGVLGCGESTDRPDETCNYRDDNANGVTDETFVDEKGAYTRLENCGRCGVDCREVFPTAAEVACRSGGAEPDGGASRWPTEPTCVLVACPPGTHLAGEGACVADAQALCTPCRMDADCARADPEARCVVFGEGDARCGRPCDPAAAPCPDGFECAPWRDSTQCLPKSGSCGCVPEKAGTTYGCWLPSPSGARFCHGVQTCDGAGLTDCRVTAVETCDGEDDDCDDLIDEDFRVDGRYQTAEHCGACDTPCVTGSENMVAHCVADPGGLAGRPRCEITCAPGFADLDDARLNGCECELVAAAWPPGAHGVDGDCDGRVDASDDYIYVSKRGDDGNPGTLEAPVARIARGLELGAARGQPVFVAQGRYDEVVELHDGVSLFGGYRSDFGARDTVVFASVIEHLTGDPGTPVLRAQGLRQQTEMVGFTLVGSDASASGGASTTAHLADCGPELELRELVVLSGAGADGEDGASSSTVLAERGIVSLDALDGTDGTRGEGGVAAQDAFCQGLASLGGQAGRKLCPLAGTDVSGGDGASADCPSTGCRAGVQCGNSGCTDFMVGGICDTDAMRREAVANDAGADGQGMNPGLGGEATYDSPTTIPLDCFCEDNPTLRREGAAGGNGAPGSEGAGGLGFADRSGRFDAETGLWSGGDGTDGTDGGDGNGAGGGSQGAGYDALESSAAECVDHIAGAGGGGGSGGCGAPLARAGMGGGGSIGVLILVPEGGRGPVLQDVTIFPAAAGRGGSGGIGAAGGRAGFGGLGGDGNFWCARAGGKGGDGGGGGHGGGGGGGGGGSISGFHVVPDALAPGEIRSYLDALAADNTVGALSAPGRGGAGGFSPGNPGTPGASGTAEAFRLFIPR